MKHIKLLKVKSVQMQNLYVTYIIQHVLELGFTTKVWWLHFYSFCFCCSQFLDLFLVHRLFSSSATSPCSSTSQMSWESVWLFPRRTGAWRWLGDEDLGCMRTRCLGFHEAGEGQRERTAEKWGDMAVLNYPDQWKGEGGGGMGVSKGIGGEGEGGGGAWTMHHFKERTQIVINETKRVRRRKLSYSCHNLNF